MTPDSGYGGGSPLLPAVGAQLEVPGQPGPQAGPGWYMQPYREALDTFARDPDTLLHALLARDRVDAELHQQAGPRGGTPTLETARRCSAALIERIGRGHPSYPDALLHQRRLLDALGHAERYGATEALTAESARSAERLNSLALAALGVPFAALEAAAPASGAGASEGPSDQLVALDKHLRQLAFKRFRALAELPQWRRSFAPPPASWWWQLDQQHAADEHERDVLWLLGAVLCGMVSLTVSLEMIKRLWSQAPDMIAIFGTILTLLLASSPLNKSWQDLSQRVLQRIPWLNPRYRGEVIFGAAALSMAIVLACWACLPLLGKLYNNWGDEALREGNLVAAEQWFARATAVAPELTVAYYNLAALYEESGSPDEALRWYRTSIEHERQFRPPYFGLGSLYNRQGAYAQAERVLLTGLDIRNERESPELTAYTNYMLLSNLGWTLIAEGRTERAETILQEALALEGSVAENNRSKIAHYAMAQVHCRHQRPEAAVDEIRNTLRFGDPTRREYQIWTATVNDYLATLEAGAPACAAIPSLVPPVAR